MIEQAMILTNYIIAYDLNKKLKTVPYRIHSSKNTDDSFDILRESIKKIENKVPKKITSDYLNNYSKNMKIVLFISFYFYNISKI